MFWKGYFGDGAGRTFALVERERLKHLVSLARAGSCSLSPWFWLTVGVLPHPCSSHSFFSCSIYIENPSREAAATGFPWEPMWNCMAVDKIKRKKKIWQQRGKPNELFFLAEFHPSSVDEMVLLGLAALQHPGTAPPRMCPLEYTKETPSTLPRPPRWAAPANNGDKNCINFKGKKSRHWHCLPGTSPQEVFLAKR